MSKVQQAAQHLATLAESGANPEKMADETRRILADWTTGAAQEGQPHQAGQMAWALREQLTHMFHGLNEARPVAVDQDKLMNQHTVDDIDRRIGCLDAVIDLLGNAAYQPSCARDA